MGVYKSTYVVMYIYIDAICLVLYDTTISFKLCVYIYIYIPVCV